MLAPDTDTIVISVLGARFTEPAWIDFLRTVAGLARSSARLVQLVVPEVLYERTEVRLRPTGAVVHDDLRAALLRAAAAS